MTPTPSAASSATADPPLDADPLTGFGAPTRAWFESSLPAPTPVQSHAWASIASGQNSLVIAPTGSGKTLAAFLHAVDRLMHEPAQPEREPGVRVLYVSPLKALAVDVERNLRAPLRGIELAAERLGLATRPISVAVRSGDTPAAERRRLVSHPPDILITTPESLFLLLSSQAAKILATVDTVILDEVHVLAGSKRGAHLMVSLERLEALNPHKPIQRIALSATVRPVERVACFVGGSRPVDVVSPPAMKTWDLRLDVPVADLTELARVSDDPDATPTQSIWPFLEEHLLELVLQHRSTLCFVNSRRVAERLTAHLNELYEQRCAANEGSEDEPDAGIVARAIAHRAPAQLMGQSGQAAPHQDQAESGQEPGVAPVLARAHHGSVSKERRAQIEADLKAGRLPCVIATSSLELGIDMGAVDLVVQVQSPPSVASGLQRVGRAGHQVGVVSKGVLLPAHRADVVESAVVAERMRAGLIEQVHLLRNPLDVLAQQLASITLEPGWSAEALFNLVRRTDSYRDLPWSAFEATLDMLAGRYPSEDFAELRPRVVWDRVSGLVEARPGVRRLVTTSGGTIPDRGLFGVFLPGATEGASAPGRRVGELDEEMVYESRVGDVFTLGTSAWRIQEITPHQVIVTPAPGQASRLPFWRGDQPSRPAELGTALGQFVDRIAAATPSEARATLTEAGLGDWAADNLLSYISEQQVATDVVPGADTIVVERFRDELGDWRVCIHCPLGSSVLAPWALAIERAAREQYGVEARASAMNDGIVLRIPDTDAAPPGAALLAIDADDIAAIVADEVLGSALFAARFRECAARALLLPRRDPNRRTPLWQQRMRAAQLLTVASQFPDFPIMLETLRECLEDVFDLPGLIELLRQIASRRVRVIEVETPQPSPFARSLLFGYVGEFIYDGDQPLAERKLAALSLDAGLLAELLGQDANQTVFDADAAAEVLAELQFLNQERWAESAEGLWDIVRRIGPLTLPEAVERSHDAASLWVQELLDAKRLALVRVNHRELLAVPDDLALLRDGLGIPPPPGYVTGPETGPQEAIDRLVQRWLRTHVTVSPIELSERYGLSVAHAQELLRTAVSLGRAVALDEESSGLSGAVISTEVLQRVRRRTLARLRAGVEPVEPQQYARFLTAWHELLPTSGQSSTARTRPANHTECYESLLTAVDQLAGALIPASMWESLVLPARVPGYTPELLDQALAQGEVVWTGAGAIGHTDGWVQLWPADAVIAQPTGETPSELAEKVLEQLAGGGAWRIVDLAAAVTHTGPTLTDTKITDTKITDTAITDAVWQLVWTGAVTADTFAPMRGLARQGALKAPRRSSNRRRLALRTPRAISQAPPGRWTLVDAVPPSPQREVLSAQLLLGRHGVVTRGGALSDGLVATWSEAYRALAGLEDVGASRRGYFVDGLGAAQFALPGAVDRLRDAEPVGVQVLAACDPANPYGAALPWPERSGHRPTRKAGALVVLDDGVPICWLERGVRTLLTFTDDAARLTTALSAVAKLVNNATLATMTIERANGVEVLEDPAIRSVLADAGFTMTPQGFRVRPKFEAPKLES